MWTIVEPILVQPLRFPVSKPPLTIGLAGGCGELAADVAGGAGDGDRVGAAAEVTGGGATDAA